MRLTGGPQVEDAAVQALEVQVRDSHLTGRSVVGHVRFPLARLRPDTILDAWVPVEGVDGGRAGEVHLQLTYKVSQQATFLYLRLAVTLACRLDALEQLLVQARLPLNPSSLCR